ncbi:uncharacterized protein G2W53_030346 [Senna tora]|uniref:Uncharacterized protein n=1 Tax=Senna tora TaxID=362788 RepID=A0A834T924_9FABA|nr:uncharacterized protein G2W53_030346 [Senna tora]
MSSSASDKLLLNPWPDSLDHEVSNSNSSPFYGLMN